jgi:RND family efflux transporter MFP subunit
VLLVLAALTAVVLVVDKTRAPQETVRVDFHNLVQSISAVGYVEPTKAIGLGFEKAGRILTIRKKVGDVVNAGEIVAELSTSDLVRERAKAQATLDAARKDLQTLETKLTSAEYTATKNALAEAERSAFQSEKTYRSLLEKNVAIATNTIAQNIDQLFFEATTSNPRVRITFGTEEKLSIESGRKEVNQRLTELVVFGNIVASTTNFEYVSTSMKQDYAEIKLFLDSLSVALARIEKTDPLVLAAQRDIDAALFALLNAGAEWEKNSNAVAKYEALLADLRTQEDERALSTAKNAVSVAEQALARVVVQFGATLLRSPTAGIITRIDARSGDVVAARVPFITLINKNQLQISSELAIDAKHTVAIGAEARVVFEQYPNEQFRATVVSVTDADSSSVSRSTKHVVMQFADADVRIVSKLQGDVTIVGAERSHVLAIPEEALFTRQGTTYVYRLYKNKKTAVPVAVGVYDNSGLVEILSGISAGDEILVR